MNDQAERYALLDTHLGHDIAIEYVGPDDRIGFVCRTCEVSIEEVDAPINTLNDLLVGTTGESIVVGNAVRLAGGVDYDVALRLAAWIVAMCDPLDERFPRILAAVRET